MFANKRETNPGISANDVYFPALFCGVEVETSLLVTEVERDDVGLITIREGEGTDSRAPDYGINFCFTLNLSV